jgi:hypothetical protein
MKHILFILFSLIIGTAAFSQSYFQFSLGVGTNANQVNVYVRPNHNNPNPAVNYVGQWNLGIQIPNAVSAGVTASIAVNNPSGIWSSANNVSATVSAVDGTFTTFAWNALNSGTAPFNWQNGVEYLAATITFTGSLNVTNQARLIDMSGDLVRYGGNTDNALVATTVLGAGGYDGTPASYSAPPFYSRVNTTIATDGTPSANPVITLNSLVVLPLQLISFTATEKNCNAIIAWKTTAEVNTKNFEVQTSTDGINFSSTTTLPAKGGTSNYGVTLQQQATTMYYRLKAVDKNGAFTYSAIVPLKISCQPKDFITIAPNPVAKGSTATLSFSTGYKGKGALLITNTLGQQILATQIVITTGINNIPISTQKLASGVYYITLVNEGGTTLGNTIKFINY